MFVCQACGRVSEPGQTSRTWIARRRRRLYELLDKDGRRVGTTSGWEIAREMRLCTGCHEEAVRNHGNETETEQ